MIYDPNIHHRRSVRLRGYDYATSGAYFITICAEKRACVFGQVYGETVEPSAVGQRVIECWNTLPSKYSEVELDAFVLMPNHMHAVFGLCYPETLADPVGAGSPRRGLGQVMGFFKYQSTKVINEARGTPGAKLWQRSYFDHVIRSNRALDAIRQYIDTNPQRWSADAENPDSDATDNVYQWVRQFDAVGAGSSCPRANTGNRAPGGENPPLPDRGAR